MSEYSDYKFYTPSESEPPKKSWWRERRTWVAAGIFLGLSLVAVLIVLLVSNLLRNQPGRGGQQDTDSLVDQLVAQCAAEDQACRDRAWSEAAQATGDAQSCSRISSEQEQLNCAALIAKETTQVTACDVLQGENRETCRDQANLFLAGETNSLTVCEAIVDPELQAGCSGRIVAEAIANNNCAAVGLPSEICDGPQRLSEAIDSGDPAACAALPAEDRVICDDSINSVDEDLDGLVSRIEFERGTDPWNPDTDGDGFSDGIEVQNGYDPLTA